MRRYGKFGILGVCLLVFSLVTGNLTPQIKQVRAANLCPPSALTPVNTSQATAALSALNNYRSSAWIGGIPVPVPLSNVGQASILSGSGLGAQNHAVYLANNITLTNSFANAYEVTANSCFTPEGNTAARYAARFANVSNLTEAVDLAMNSVYLRLPLLEPRLQTVGLGFDTSFAVIDDTNASSQNFRSTAATNFSDGYLIGFPGPNSASVPISVPTSFIYGEGITFTDVITVPLSRPRLAGGIKSGTNSGIGIYGDPIGNPFVVGYPISLQIDPVFYGTVAKDNVIATLKDISDTVVPTTVLAGPADVAAVYTSLKGDPNYNTLVPLSNAIVVIPNKPLQTNTQYVVSITFTGSNLAAPNNTRTAKWSFTTTTTGTGTVTPGTGTPGTLTPGNGSPAPTSIIVPTSAALTPTPTQGLPGAPGLPPNAGPTSFYTPTPADGENPPQFFQVWRRADDPVKYGYASRSWLYGPLPYGFAILYENYEGGRRIVAYHDKARMEITNPNTGYVSNGLLVKEMISGAMQVGDSKYEIRTSSLQTVVGDPFELNPQAPTYASFARVASLNNDKRAPNRTGQQVIETMTRDGTTGANVGTAAYGVTYSYYDPNLGHNIPDRFWRFMNQYGLVNDGGYYNATVFNWVTVMGLPLSEPYWVQATVGGQVKDVLVQVFERRVLTFTPSNTPAFQVEMGNAGRHYFQWRYGNSGP